jgi:hypothetical protein
MVEDIDEERRQRKILRYRAMIWNLLKEQFLITDDMRVDPPYRQNLILLKKLAGALIIKLGDTGAVPWLEEQIKGYYHASMVPEAVKGMEKLFEDACRDYQCKESEVESYLRQLQPGGKL